MASLVVGGVTIPVAISSPAWSRSDAVDRGRMFDGTFFASESGGASRDWTFSTPPVTQADADTYIAALSSPAAKLCSGDIIQIPTMCSPELPSGKPTRAASGNRVVLDFMLHEIMPAKVLLRYAPGDTITGESFTRSTTGRFYNAAGVVGTEGINVKRDNHYVGGVRTLLLEDSRTNPVIQSENFGVTWVTANSPTRVAANNTSSGVSLDLIGDDNAAAVEGYEQILAFTGNAVKAISLFVQQGTSASSVIRLKDNTAGINRLLAVLTWSGGLPSVAMTTGTFLGYDTLLSCFRLTFATTSVTAANSNELGIYPATNAALDVANTGTLDVGGVQAEDAIFPSSYIKTTTIAVTRAGDTYSFPFSIPPQELTVYTKFVELGTAQSVGGHNFSFGSAGQAAPIFICYAPAGFYRAYHSLGGALTVFSTLAAAPSVGSVAELMSRLFGDGSVDITQSIAGAAPTAGAQSAANTLGAAWSGLFCWLNSGGSGAQGFAAFQSFKIVAGARSLVEMRAA